MHADTSWRSGASSARRGAPTQYLHDTTHLLITRLGADRPRWKALANSPLPITSATVYRI
eukprot:3397508-Pleurochrysis_carterae.AAC.2